MKWWMNLARQPHINQYRENSTKKEDEEDGVDESNRGYRYRENRMKKDGEDESNRGCEHAAAKPDGISLHLVRNHLHVDRLRL